MKRTRSESYGIEMPTLHQNMTRNIIYSKCNSLPTRLYFKCKSLHHSLPNIQTLSSRKRLISAPSIFQSNDTQSNDTPTYEYDTDVNISKLIEKLTVALHRFDNEQCHKISLKDKHHIRNLHITCLKTFSKIEIVFSSKDLIEVLLCQCNLFVLGFIDNIYI